MGTSWSAQLYAPSPPDCRALQTRIESRLLQINAQMSTWDADSLISRINSADKGWYALPDDFYAVISAALALAEQTQGAFDPTLGELINLWGFGAAGPVYAPPRADALRTALLRSGWRKTVLNRQHHALWQPGGLHFDFSSIAKGYAVDEMARVLDHAGIPDYLVELGGEMKARGKAQATRPWRVDIEHPNAHTRSTRENTHNEQETENPESAFPIVLDNAALATSGDYLRNFTSNHTRYSHTLDGRTGQPIANQLAAVSVIHESTMQADALATALQCLGPLNGWAFAQENDLAALFFIRRKDDYEVRFTPAFARKAGAAPMRKTCTENKALS
ncbi:MAG TPA: thiamine biosynthesis protein ApbE [Pusillimonas sp.]|jgi:thiamine biosynthesis lipoprotein|nr:thiamine biosynthesis protein ApbE [Pusillimonas sp.]|tara:strand:+ start:231828 stop:232826 length:999 start_codon:yes stop_codon:yes gene_type:complete